MLRILDLFEEHNEGWSAEQLHAVLGYSRSTLYRYLKMLTDSGLLTSLPGIGYALGPRIIELDHRIRTTDPLIRAAKPLMQELAKEFPGTALLCRLYRDKVLCVHQESGTEAFHTNFERGHVRPLSRGAASMVILANLPAHRLTRLYRDYARDFEAAGLGANLTEVRNALKKHRKLGWAVAYGQVTPDAAGIAAALFDGGNEVLGSLIHTLPAEGLSAERVQIIAQRVTFYARIISNSLGSAQEQG